jgi:protoporphyrin/coproporphyrin ferrochelatase
MPSPTGVLLIQLGTPKAPTVPEVRRYLREFLSDRRVIEAPRVPWWFVLNFRILTTRPRESALKYQRVWDPITGSPLLHFTKRQADALQKALPHLTVRFGMQVGSPAVASVVSEMIEQGLERLIVLPMYPQYSATTTASACDALFRALMRERRVPAVRIVPPYYAHPTYVDALAAVIFESLKNLAWQPERYLLSFHGLPVKYVQRGDPYPEQVERTTELLTQRLGWTPETWTQTYQSRFGRDPWLEPYTDRTLEQFARQGVKRVLVATPGFTADCLETIDEIGFEAREAYRHAGGQEFYRCPCLNDHPAWIESMKSLVLEEGRGWI